METKELFEDYEMRSWDITPRIYKILGVATVLNFLIIFIFGQFNLLNTRGCDTPYVGIVCQVLDSAYIASTFLGKDNSWESRPYAASEIEDADITFIDVSDQLKYPEGYFALANPEQTSENLSPTDMSGFTNTTDLNPTSTSPTPADDLMSKVQVIPTPNDKVGKQNAPDLPYQIGGNPAPTYKNPPIVKNKPAKQNNRVKNLPNDSPNTLPPDDKIIAKVTPKPTPSPTPTDDEAKSQFAEKFNKKPLQDFAEDVIAKLDDKDPAKKIDLKQPFKVVLDGTLTKDGKFDAKKTRFVVNKGEDTTGMTLVAKDAIQKLGDSGLLSYLTDLNVEKVNITLIQDDKQIFAIIRSDQPNESRAKTISSGFNILISGAKGRVKEEDVKALLNAVQFKPDGKSFVINFAMPKDEAHKLIDQKLQEARQKKSQTNNSEGVKDPTAKGE